MKNPNPLTIYKDTSPYLYLTDQSGLYINEYDTVSLDRGAKLYINSSSAQNYNLMQLQVWVRYNSDTFSSSASMLEIYGLSSSVIFNAIPETGGKRAKISTSYESVKFYQNGIETKYPVLYTNEWTALNIVFLDPISFNNYIGEIILRPKFLFNNISEFVYENALEIISRSIQNIWMEILSPDLEFPLINNTWSDINSQGNWQQAVTDIIQTQASIRGDYIYNDQTGTSTISVEDYSRIEVFSNGADIFTDISWQTIEKNAI